MSADFLRVLRMSSDALGCLGICLEVFEFQRLSWDVLAFLLNVLGRLRISEDVSRMAWRVLRMPYDVLRLCRDVLVIGCLSLSVSWTCVRDTGS